MPNFPSPNTVIPTEQEVTVVPSVKIDPKLKEEILSQVEEQGMVIVHCSVSAPRDIGVRIWSSTFLVDRVSGSKSQLLHALNISYAPIWELVKGGTTKKFVLIFSALPKTCEIFDFIEEIPDSFGFEYYGIKRNSSDVYNLNINETVL